MPSRFRRFQRAPGRNPCGHSCPPGDGQPGRRLYMSIRFVRLAIAGLTAFALTPLLTEANAQERVRWKMQSAFGSTLPHLGASGVRFSKDIERLSGGRFDVKFFEPGALIPPLECFDAVSKGSIEVVLDHARLSHRQVSGARFLHHRAVRARLRRIPRLEMVRRRQQAARRSLRQARPGRVRLLLHRPGDLRLVPQRDQVARRARRA